MPRTVRIPTTRALARWARCRWASCASRGGSGRAPSGFAQKRAASSPARPSMSTAERSTAADPVLDLFGPSHIGIVVDDLQSAMAELGAAWRTSWSPGRDGSVGIPFRGAAGIKTVYLKTAWGERGPLRVELIEAVADTIWPPGGGAYLH